MSLMEAILSQTTPELFHLAIVSIEFFCPSTLYMMW